MSSIELPMFAVSQLPPLDTLVDPRVLGDWLESEQSLYLTGVPIPVYQEAQTAWYEATLPSPNRPVRSSGKQPGVREEHGLAAARLAELPVVAYGTAWEEALGQGAWTDGLHVWVSHSLLRQLRQLDHTSPLQDPALSRAAVLMLLVAEQLVPKDMGLDIDPAQEAWKVHAPGLREHVMAQRPWTDLVPQLSELPHGKEWLSRLPETEWAASDVTRFQNQWQAAGVTDDIREDWTPVLANWTTHPILWPGGWVSHVDPNSTSALWQHRLRGIWKMVEETWDHHLAGAATESQVAGALRASLRVVGEVGGMVTEQTWKVRLATGLRDDKGQLPTAIVSKAVTGWTGGVCSHGMDLMVSATTKPPAAVRSKLDPRWNRVLLSVIDEPLVGTPAQPCPVAISMALRHIHDEATLGSWVMPALGTPDAACKLDFNPWPDVRSYAGTKSLVDRGCSLPSDWMHLAAAWSYAEVHHLVTSENKPAALPGLLATRVEHERPLDKCRDPATAAYLVDLGAPLQVTRLEGHRQGWTAAHHAAARGYPQVVEALLGKGLVVREAPTTDSLLPLLVMGLKEAHARDQMDVPAVIQAMEAALQAGASSQGTTRSGMNALHAVTRLFKDYADRDNTDIPETDIEALVHMLVKAGCPLHARVQSCTPKHKGREENLTVLDLAVGHFHDAVAIPLLQQLMQDAQQPTQEQLDKAQRDLADSPRRRELMRAWVERQILQDTLAPSPSSVPRARPRL